MEYIEHNWEAHKKWNQENGDETHRLNYDLNEKSIVFDIGGYKGEWSEKIFNKYKCSIYIFEPVLEFYNIIKSKFHDNNKIKIFNFGLGPNAESIFIDLAGDGSGYMSENSSLKEQIEIKSLINFLSDSYISKIDLVKINIEAAEFDLLDDIIKHKKANIFDNIQVQFHTFIPDCVERREKIRKELSITHGLTYDFTFIWENWKIKN